jgi:hypothetical protein
MDNRDDFITELAKIFAEEAEAQALLEDIRFPRAYWPNWNAFRNPRAYWARVITEIENGRVRGLGPDGLARVANRRYPENRLFRETVEHDPGPLEETKVDPEPEPRFTGRARAAAEPETAERKVWPTLLFQGSDQYDDLVRLVRQVVGPQAEMLYATGEEAAVLVPDEFDETALLEQIRRAVEDLGTEEIRVLFERFPFAPHLIQRIRLVGPDQQVFYAEDVPNTTPVRDLPYALLAQYGEQTRQDRLGRTRRTVVDRVVPGARPGAPPTETRLDPDRTLHEAGVREGDELHIRPESTAGAVSQRLRRSALATARNEIREYEETHPDFEVLDTDHEILPTVYDIKFEAPGFAPPADLDRPPDELRPIPRDEHQAQIILSDQFPLKAPYVLFSTPIFHPNVEPGGNTDRPKGMACIGLLGDNAYRADLDFHELCALIKDMAAYRNYGALPHGMLDAHGFLDPTAAEWARSDAGQEMIVARGGVALLPLLGIDEAPPPKRLRITRPEPGARR